MKRSSSLCASISFIATISVTASYQPAAADGPPLPKAVHDTFTVRIRSSTTAPHSNLAQRAIGLEATRSQHAIAQNRTASSTTNTAPQHTDTSCDGSAWDDFTGSVFRRASQLSDYIVCIGTPAYSINSTNQGATQLQQDFSQLAAFIIDSDRLYPGSLIDGSQAQIKAGHLAPIFPQGGPGTVTITGVTFADGTKSASRHISHNSLSEITDAINDLTHDPILPDQLLTVSSNYRSVYSEDQAALALNASFSGPNANASGFFNTATDNTKNKVEFVIIQTLFEASFTPDNQEKGPASFFSNGTSRGSAKKYLTSESPPLYVSNIGYGRALYFMFSCSSSMQRASEGISAAISSIMYSGSANVSAMQRSALSQCTAQTLAIGGHYSYAIPVLTPFTAGIDLPERLATYISGNMHSSNPGSPVDIMYAQPLWYKLSYVANLQPAALSTTLHYDPIDIAPRQYTSMNFWATICDDDKEWQTNLNASINGADGTNYFSNLIFGNDPCGGHSDENNCSNGWTYYWGTHGATYPVPPITLSRPMDAYDAANSTFTLNAGGASWNASFRIVGNATDGSSTTLAQTQCINFNNANGSGAGPTATIPLG